MHNVRSRVLKASAKLYLTLAHTKLPFSTTTCSLKPWSAVSNRPPLGFLVDIFQLRTYLHVDLSAVPCLVFSHRVVKWHMLPCELIYVPYYQVLIISRDASLLMTSSTSLTPFYTLISHPTHLTPTPTQSPWLFFQFFGYFVLYPLPYYVHRACSRYRSLPLCNGIQDPLSQHSLGGCFQTRAPSL